MSLWDESDPPDALLQPLLRVDIWRKVGQGETEQTLPKS